MKTFLRTTESYRQGVRTLPREYYTSGEVYAEEQETVFARRWLCVGRADQIPAPGDYFLQAVGAESLIIVRDRRGVAHAFYNVCRHRGTRLCERDRGRFSETIQCPYHAWTYTTGGQLIGAPHMHEVAGFDKRDYPLHEAALREWEGFLFLSLAAEPEPFETAFASLLGRFARFELAGLRVGHRVEYDVRANWKLIVQNYSECLHCPTIHPQLSRLLPYQSGENDLVEGPFLGGYMAITEPNASATVTGRACALPLGDLPEEDRHRAYFYTIFPNMMLSLHPDYVDYYMLWPQGPDRTTIVNEWLFRPEAFDAPGFNPGDAVEFWDQTNRQDWHICEQSQAGIASRVYAPGPYSPRESLPAAWDREYLRIMSRG
jgi:Rieske 2Fe-2S family protein